MTSLPHSRQLLAALYEAAVSAVSPAPLTAAALANIDAPPDQRTWIFAVGKAAPAMANGAVGALRRSLHTIAGGVVVAPDTFPSPFSTVRTAVGDHPIPGEHSFAAARLVDDTASAVRADDAAIVLISGGTTSLMASPVRGVGEEELRELFVLLMDAGIDIGVMNAVRKRFLRWGAGRLAVALAPARIHVLLLSDVPGNAPADIGSGPCAPDQWTAPDVASQLRDAGLLDRLPPSLREHLHLVVRGMGGETPKPGDPAFAHVTTRVVGTNDIARDAALTAARALGLRAERGALALAGEAARCGDDIVTELLQRAARGERGCIVWGGETTVRMNATSCDGCEGDQPTSITHAAGGRCQELALAAARRLATAGEGGARITLLAAGTDGRDGPTDAAGAFADASLWRRVLESGADPDAALRFHRSYAALHAAGALFRHDATGTNVMDLVIGVVE
jgi:glycerate 2-kinase